MRRAFFFKFKFSSVGNWKKGHLAIACLGSLKYLSDVTEKRANKQKYVFSQRLVSLWDLV